MKLSSFLTSFTLVVAAAASTIPKRGSGWQDCLSQHTANKIVRKFITILQHLDVPAANQTAQALLADDFQEISDSILSLQGQPVSNQGIPIFLDSG
jgi:hypothetical protein